ncbi:uroporphyrinogen-III C-methyltransferase [Aestuariirhabdus sp. LZHN29]|uniref:uroporphyrinogen-III C-methyltransferase n=1 Tax=Aestuariirhabdus sp. LZHN29 TaxID=3417462 RepID=UPI003CEBAB61
MSKKRGKHDSEKPSEQESPELSTDESTELSPPNNPADVERDGAEPPSTPVEPKVADALAEESEQSAATTEAVSRVSDEQIQAAALAAATRPSPHAKKGEDSVSRADALKSTGEAVPPKVATGGRSWLALLALVLAFVACAGVAALVYMDRDIQYYLEHRSYPDAEQQLASDLQSLAGRLESSNSALREELSALSPLAESQVQFEERLRATGEKLDQNSQSLQSQLNELQRTSRDDWQLAEVEYLLRLANQRLLTEGSISGVEALLTSADRIVRDLDNVSLFPVREALAADLVAIRAVPRVDSEGVYLQLAALAEQAMALPLLPVDGYQIAGTAPAEVVVAEEQPLLQRLWVRGQASLERFTQYFRLNTHRSEPLQELLTPDEEVYLRQNLRLMMEQAQLALLKGQQRVYDASLRASLDWLERYFSYNSQASVSMVKQLQQLQSLQLSPDLPDISGSLKAIKAFNEQLHRREEAAQ